MDEIRKENVLGEIRKLLEEEATFESSIMKTEVVVEDGIAGARWVEVKTQQINRYRSDCLYDNLYSDVLNEFAISGSLKVNDPADQYAAYVLDKVRSDRVLRSVAFVKKVNSNDLLIEVLTKIDSKLSEGE